MAGRHRRDDEPDDQRLARSGVASADDVGRQASDDEIDAGETGTES